MNCGQILKILGFNTICKNFTFLLSLVDMVEQDLNGTKLCYVMFFCFFFTCCSVFFLLFVFLCVFFFFIFPKKCRILYLQVKIINQAQSQHSKF